LWDKTLKIDHLTLPGTIVDSDKHSTLQIFKKELYSEESNEFRKNGIWKKTSIVFLVESIFKLYKKKRSFEIKKFTFLIIYKCTTTLQNNFVFKTTNGFLLHNVYCLKTLFFMISLNIISLIASIKNNGF